MNPVSTIANVAGDLFGVIGGIITNAQIIRQIREQQNLVQYSQLPDWVSPSDIILEQKQLEAASQNNKSMESQIVTAGLVLIIVIMVIGIVTIVIRKSTS